MSAQRWLYSAITVAFGYTVYLIIALFNREILLPGQHNSAVLAVLSIVCLVAALNYFNGRRQSTQREYLDRRFGYLEMRVDRIIDGPTKPLLRIVASAPVTPGGTLVDTRSATVTQLPQPDAKYMEEAAEYYELGRRAGHAEREQEPPEGK